MRCREIRIKVTGSITDINKTIGTSTATSTTSSVFPVVVVNIPSRNYHHSAHIASIPLVKRTGFWDTLVAPHSIDTVAASTSTVVPFLHTFVSICH